MTDQRHSGLLELARAVAAHTEATEKRRQFERTMPRTRQALRDLEELWRVEIKAGKAAKKLARQHNAPARGADHD